MKNSSQDTSAEITSTRKWLFRTVLILLPFLFLGFLELALRLFSYGDDLRLFIPDPYVDDYLTVNLQVGRRYFSTKEAGSFGAQNVFRKNKQPNTLRVFALGGSTTAGYPYMHLGTFPAMLKDRLVYSYPDHEIEMVNLGMTAVTSFTVLDFGKGVLQNDPDLIVVYAGHNEFYGALGSGSNLGSKGSRTLTLLYLKLNHWKLFQLMRNLLHSTGQLFTGDDGAPEGTLMERMVKDKAIPHSSDQYIKTIETFETNLREMVEAANYKGVPVILGTIVSNLRTQKPFVSILKDPSNESDIKGSLEQAKKLITKNNYQGALNILSETVSLDSSYALTHFIIALCHDRLGNYSTALQSYTQARNLDGLRFRAGTEVNDIIRSITGNNKIYLADIETAFYEASPGRIIGPELMLEHLHPNLDGYSLMAKTFAEVITQADILNTGSAPRPAQTDRWYRERSGITSLDTKMADYRLAILRSGWPFKKKGRTLYPEDIKTKTFLEKQAKAVVASNSNYEKAHVSLAEHYRNEGKLDSAIIEFKALAKAFPVNESPYANLGRLLVQTNQKK